MLIIDALHKQASAGYAKPWTYRKWAPKEFLTFICNRKPRETTIRKAIRKQLLYVERNLQIISDYGKSRMYSPDKKALSRSCGYLRTCTAAASSICHKRQSLRDIEGIMKWCVQLISIGHGRTCVTVRERDSSLGVEAGTVIWRTRKEHAETSETAKIRT